jgi:cell division septal protein FtsQ
MNQKKIVKKKKHINYKRLIVVLLLLYFVIYLIIQFINTPIKNIYVENNAFLTDQEIIDAAKVSNYPSIFTLDTTIESNLKSDIYIKSAKVYKKNFTELHLVVEENYPLFINKNTSKTVLLNKMEVDRKFSVATLINYVPDTIYNSFVNKVGEVNKDILLRISEIEYRPNDVDTERFLLSMNDGNYVYLTLSKFSLINNYIDIIKEVGNKKGILYLDSGGYFELKEE